MLLGQLMLALPRLGLNQGHLMFVAIGPQPSREGPGHLPQLVVIEIAVAAVELAPPGAQAPAGLAHLEVGIEHDTVDAIVSALQQSVRVITGQLSVEFTLKV